MRKAQAQHAQSQAQARLLAQLHAAQSAHGPGPEQQSTASALAAVTAAAAMAASTPQPIGLFGAPDLPVGAGGSSGNQFGGHTAGAQSSPLSLITKHPAVVSAAAVDLLAAAAVADAAAHQPPQTARHLPPEPPEAPERSAHQHCTQCHHQKATTHVCHHHYHHCQTTHQTHYNHHRQHINHGAGESVGRGQRQRCADCMHQPTTKTACQATQTLPRNITFASDQQRRQSPAPIPLPCQFDSGSDAGGSCACWRQPVTALRAPVAAPPAHLAGAAGRPASGASTAAAAAAAQFVNMHRKNKGLPPSTNPNFAQFNATNSPFPTPYNRATETIFGIRPSDIDKYSRVVFPVCFVCFQLMYWIVYLHISAFLESEQGSSGSQQPVAPTTPSQQPPIVT